MIWRNRGFMNLAACTASCVALWIVWSAAFVAAQSSWQAEWEKTLRAAEAEGQFALYCCCYDYDRVLEGIQEKILPCVPASRPLTRSPLVAFAATMSQSPVR